jgi:hypothetical protein
MPSANLTNLQTFVKTKNVGENFAGRENNRKERKDNTLDHPPLQFSPDPNEVDDDDDEDGVFQSCLMD